MNIDFYDPTTTLDRYSKQKIVWHPDKLKSFVSNKLTAPLNVRIKPINACNHSCYWCAYHSPDMSKMHLDMKPKDMIEIDKLYEILDDFVDMGIKAVTYSGGGDPLLHPHAFEFLKRTLDNKLEASVITHGQFIKNKIAEVLTDFKWVRVSVDYYNALSFSESRHTPQRCYDEIMQNLENFARNKKNCELEVNFVITKHNYKHLDIITRIYKDIGVNNIRFSPMWVHNFQEYHSQIKEFVYNELESIKARHEVGSFKIYSSYNPKAIDSTVTSRPYTKCFIMQIKPVIGADLNVYTCHNQAYSNDSIIASIKNQSFKNAWFNSQPFHQEFKCQTVCTGQCADDRKNIFIHDLIGVHGDNFI